MCETNFIDKIKTMPFKFSNFFFSENSAVYEITWKEGQSETGHRWQYTVARVSCWVTKATETHSKYVICLAFVRQKWLDERASMLRVYVHCVSCSRIT